MRRIVLLLVIPFTLIFQKSYPQNAPITHIGHEIAFGETAVVPITVANFNNIGSCEYMINFDPNKVTITAVTLGPGVSSYYFLNGEVSPGVYKVTWLFFQFMVDGLTLPDNSVFMNIHLQRTAFGFNAIEFDFSSPQNCIYTDWQYNGLTSIPTASFFYDGSVSFATGASQWTGDIDNDWSNPLNWDSDVPGPTSIAVIQDVVAKPFPVTNDVADCLGLSIEAGASLTIPPNNNLTVYGNVENNGQLTIQSDASGSGSFIYIGTVLGNGLATTERYLSSEMWHYVSSPVSDGLTGIFTGIYLKKFIESTGGWQYITSQNEPLSPMQGFASWASDAYTGSTTVFYSGNLNIGQQTAATLTNTPGFQSSGYNLVGNPFTSAINWDAPTGWEKTNIDNAIYIFNGNNGNYGSYINGISLNSVNNYIPSGQGFFVKVSNEFTTGSITVKPEAREHHAHPFLKSVKSNTDNQTLRLLTFSNLNQYVDEALIVINEASSGNFDQQFDAYKLTGNADAPQLFTVTPGGDFLSVNSLNKTTDNITVPLHFQAGLDGIYSIKASEILNFESTTDVFLEDKFDNIIIDLKQQPVYSFFANNGDEPDRFLVHLHFNPAAIASQQSASDYHVYAYQQTVKMEALNGKSINGVVNVYSVLGQNIFTKKISHEPACTLHLHKSGVYLISYFDEGNQKHYNFKISLD